MNIATQLQNRLEYLLFIFFSKLFNLLGLKKARKFSVVITLFFYYILPIRKSIVKKNLRIAFPLLSENDLNKLCFRVYRSFTITLVEILLLPFLPKEELNNQIKIKNIGLISEKFRMRKGVILLSAHFGNWEYIALSAAMKAGIPFSVVIKPQRNPYINTAMNNYRTKWGNKIVPLGISIRQIYKELKEKNVVAMVADQRGPREGVRVSFFNSEVSVYTGPAALAVKTGAPVIFGAAVRQPDYTYETELVEIPTNDLTGNEEEKILTLSQRHTLLLENLIHLYPEQWLWMHDRWKY
ncbi:MAG: lysophospholipid acyltransferase family protein [Ignavibacteriaceae bacterium]